MPSVPILRMDQRRTPVDKFRSLQADVSTIMAKGFVFGRLRFHTPYPTLGTALWKRMNDINTRQASFGASQTSCADVSRAVACQRQLVRSLQFATPARRPQRAYRPRNIIGGSVRAQMLAESRGMARSTERDPNPSKECVHAPRL